jgi:hypothetical protein
VASIGSEMACPAIALTATTQVPPLVPVAQPSLARALLSQGRTGEALSYALEASRSLESAGPPEDGEALIRLIAVECLFAANRNDAGCEALRRATNRLHDRAALIDDPELREAFMSRIPDHKRTVVLAQRYLSAPAPLG